MIYAVKVVFTWIIFNYWWSSADKWLIHYILEKKDGKSLCCTFVCILNFKGEKFKLYLCIYFYFYFNFASFILFCIFLELEYLDFYCIWLNTPLDIMDIYGLGKSEIFVG